MDNRVVRKDKYENYLLVEGGNDKHVFHHLLNYHQIREQFKIKGEFFDIKDHEGIDNLLSSRTLRAYLKVDEPRRFGIVVDADTDLATRWQRLRTILGDFGYRTVPINPKPEGTVILEEDLPTVGVWLMPDNKISAMIEDFVSFLVPRDDLLWPIAGDVLQKVIERDCRFRETYKGKACLHTWLAWQKEPGTSLGLAITRHYVDAAAPQAQQLIDWLRRLFDLEPV